MLHFLASNDNLVDVIKASILDVNACNFDNDTPLHIALRTRAFSNAKMLLSKGAQVDVCGSKGQSSNFNTFCFSFSKFFTLH